MATLRVLAGTGETVTNTERVVTSALSINAETTLPVILDGSGATVPVGYTVTFESTAGGEIIVLDQNGRRIVIVEGGRSIQVYATPLLQWRVSEAGCHNRTVRAEDKLTNGTVAAVLTANGPTGMGTAVVGWTTETLPDGTLAKRPYWV